nr:hypothetical protein [Tanacetum cinerariifolium]
MLRDIDETFCTLRKINMKLNPKSTIKEVQSLNEKLASLNRFLSKSAEKSLPLCKTLKKCIKKSDFHWTAEAKQAFKQLNNTYRYLKNKLGESIQQAIQSHTAECRKEAQADKNEYIDLIDTSMRAIIKEEVKTQLPRILPKAVLDFATHVIEKNVTKSLETAVLAKSSSQPKSTYVAAASLSEFELIKILIDKMEEHKSYLCVDYKRELYDALVRSYNTEKDLFETYGKVFTLKRSREDKDQDPSAGSDRGTKRRKSSKEAGLSKDPRSNESKSPRSPKGTSRSQHRPSEKSAHAEEPRHTFDDSGVKQNQGFDKGNNDEQPIVEAAPKVNCDMARVEKLPTSFDELMDIPIDFSAFVMNRLNITDLTQEILVGLVFNLLKGTYKSRTKLEYHFEECFKATTHRRQSVSVQPQEASLVDSRLSRMDYLSKNRWNRIDKRRARVMIQDIDKQLRDRRLMRSLKKFVGGREYGEDLRLLERTI